MTVRLLSAPEYRGISGVMAIRSVQQELTKALQQEDWDKIRHLDRICVLLIDRVIAANSHDKSTLVSALGELKGVYAGLIAQCYQEVTLLQAT